MKAIRRTPALLPRRDFLAVAAMLPLAGCVPAMKAPASAKPAVPAPAETPADPMAKLRAVNIPTGTEPASVFKVLR